MSVGVNLAGAEFGRFHVYGKDYIYPSAEDLDYFASKGVDLVRLPFKWERMQPTLFGELNSQELQRMETFLAEAAARGIRVVIDLHNYGRYDGKVLGSAELPNSAFAVFWGKLATELEGNPGLAGYGLMNEPHDMGGSTVWPNAAQAAVDAIRRVDASTAIFVCGDDWASAARWKSANPGFPLRDPSGNIVYEAHVYFDRDQSGTYQGTYDEEGAHPDIGVNRVKPFLDWLKENNATGFIGEFGVPNDDPRWLEVLDRFLKEVDAAGVDATYWAAGPWWGDYRLSVQPTAEGRDKPQMSVLEKYTGDELDRICEIPLPAQESLTAGGSASQVSFVVAPPSAGEHNTESGDTVVVDSHTLMLLEPAVALRGGLIRLEENGSHSGIGSLISDFGDGLSGRRFNLNTSDIAHAVEIVRKLIPDLTGKPAQTTGLQLIEALARASKDAGIQPGAFKDGSHWWSSNNGSAIQLLDLYPHWRSDIAQFGVNALFPDSGAWPQAQMLALSDLFSAGELSADKRDPGEPEMADAGGIDTFALAEVTAAIASMNGFDLA